ncbi:hypothetical protein TNCV_4507881 [Trichonephila clavipes]|nr:hypothetical protein TNCV_4507881 [Trichonephila clavipes]
MLFRGLILELAAHIELAHGTLGFHEEHSLKTTGRNENLIPSRNKQNTENTNLDSPTVSSEEFVAVYMMIMCVPPDILELVRNSKINIDANSDDENETNNAPSVPTSSEMRNIMKSGEMSEMSFQW